MGRLPPSSLSLGRQPELLPTTGSGLVSTAWPGGVPPCDIHGPEFCQEGGGLGERA